MTTSVSMNCSVKISRECKSNHFNSHSFHIVQIMDKRQKLNMIKCRVYPMKVEETLFFCCVQPDKVPEYSHSTILRYSCLDACYMCLGFGDDFNQGITMNIIEPLALLPEPWYVTMDSTGITTTGMTYSFNFLKLNLVSIKQLMPGLEIS